MVNVKTNCYKVSNALSTLVAQVLRRCLKDS